MEKIKKKVSYIIGCAIFAFSCSMLAIQLIVVNYYSNLNILLTGIVSFITAIFILKKTAKENYKNIKENIGATIFYIILTVIVLIQLYLTKKIECTKIKAIINPFRIRFFIISAISAIYLGIYLGNKIKNWIINFYKMLDTWDKKAYVIVSIITTIIIIMAYNSNSNWYLQYDKVYSLDSGYCFNKIFSKSTYYDIRHPLLSIFTFPIWAIVETLINFTIRGNLSTIIKAIILQFINAQLLILIGFQIKILTKNKLVFIMYMLSFPTILYSMFFEKYQLCVFLIVLYVFSICIKKESSIAALISSASVMPTSSVIGISEFFTNKKITEKIKKVLKIIVITIVTFICLGRGHVIKYGMSEMMNKKERFSNKTYTISEKFIATTKMFQNSFIGLPSNTTVRKNIYWWDGLSNEVSILAFAIIAVIVIGAICNRKKLFVKISSVWVAFSTVLFMVLNWSTHETPLFTIYFSWAIIPLFIMGLDVIVKKLKINSKVVYSFILGIMVIINIVTMLDINTFLFKL